MYVIRGKMIIKLETIKDNGFIQENVDLNLKDYEVFDALLKKINSVKGTIKITYLGSNQYLVDLVIQYNVDYLDARNLKPLNLTFDLNDSFMFSDSINLAKELDIDYIENEIDVDHLLKELIIVSVPFNYSEEEKIVKTIEEENEYKPFLNIKTKEE